HQPTVDWNIEVGLELPSANVLRNRAVQNERIEEVDMIGDEETRCLWIEALRGDAANLCAGEENDAPAKRALQPVMRFRVQKNGQTNEHRHRDAEMQKTKRPEEDAAESQPGALHM